MIYGMVVSARPIKIFTSTTEMSTVHTHPEVSPEVTVSTFTILHSSNYFSFRLVQVLGASTFLELELPLFNSSLIKGRIRQENRIDETGYLRVGHVKVLIASSAENRRISIVFISISINTTWLTNSELGDLLRLSRFFLRSHCNVHEDTVTCQLVVHGGMVAAAATVGLKADVKTSFMLGSLETTSAFVFINHDIL
jgi:hypothetical protein